MINQTQHETPSPALKHLSMPGINHNQHTTSGHVQHLKSCQKCKESKAWDQFSIDRRTVDGHQRYCKVCNWIYKYLHGYGKHNGKVHVSVRQEIGYVRYLSILLRDNFECQLCDKPVTAISDPWTPKAQEEYYEDSACNLDHIAPRTLEGESTDENIQTTCRACNMDKGVAFLPLRMKGSVEPFREVAITIMKAMIAQHTHITAGGQAVLQTGTLAIPAHVLLEAIAAYNFNTAPAL